MWHVCKFNSKNTEIHGFWVQKQPKLQTPYKERGRGGFFLERWGREKEDVFEIHQPFSQIWFIKLELQSIKED